MPNTKNSCLPASGLTLPQLDREECCFLLLCAGHRRWDAPHRTPLDMSNPRHASCQPRKYLCEGLHPSFDYTELKTYGTSLCGGQ